MIRNRLNFFQNFLKHKTIYSPNFFYKSVDFPVRSACYYYNSLWKNIIKMILGIQLYHKIHYFLLYFCVSVLISSSYFSYSSVKPCMTYSIYRVYELSNLFYDKFTDLINQLFQTIVTSFMLYIQLIDPGLYQFK